ncbi:MAG TPA: uracil-DNA glycosylase family protein [Spirochaetia bacterium]|nr:uracil-DNA glycosylase family protein [Spirochaetia bacterium]
MTADDLVQASRRLAWGCRQLRFSPQVRHVYHALLYARAPHEAYLRMYGATPKTVVFLGMNPGPWGMAQTGIPFGEVEIVRDWLLVSGAVREPSGTHRRVPVRGFSCSRSEVSGRRLWGLMRDRFGSPGAFFADHFVANYCPLLFLDAQGRNITPDKIPTTDRAPLERLCDAHVVRIAEALRPKWMVGVGRFAERRLTAIASEHGWRDIRIASIPHPSPASPKANRDWAGDVIRVLCGLGIWATEDVSREDPPRERSPSRRQSR